MYKPRLKIIHNKVITVLLMNKLKLLNIMQVPTIKKIVINIGLGEAVKNDKCIELCKEYLFLITGQTAVTTRAKKSIAFFKLRKGMPIGVKVTLRNNKLWEFLDKLLNIVFPRIRDFKGIKVNFDKSGNFSLGLKEQIIFPEISYDKIDKIRGFGITFVMNTINKDYNFTLLNLLGFPIKR